MAKRPLTEDEIARRERWGKVHVDADRRAPFGFVTRRAGQVMGNGTRYERGAHKANNTNG